MAIGNVVRPAGRQDRGGPTLGGDGSGKRRQDWQAEIDHGGKEELGDKRDGSEPSAAGPRDPRLPWWIPDPAEGGVAVELQEAITQLILPAYQQLVLEAPSMMERVAGEMLIQALWADCLRQWNRPVIGSGMLRQETTGRVFPAGPDQQTITGPWWCRAAPLAFGGFDGRSKKALILRSSFCELFYSTLWYDAPPHTAGQAGSGTPVETPSPVAHHALRYGHGGHLDGCSGGPSRGAEIPGARACDQTVREKTDAALHPIHCVMVMAATWTDAPADHGEGRTSPARGPVARRRTRKSDAALHPMHCVNGHGGHLDGCSGGPSRGAEIPGARACGQTAREKLIRHCIPCIALTARRSRSGSLCSGHATGSASRWCRPSLRERTKLSRSERRLISPRRFPTTPLNLPVWSARRPRFWARRSRPGISWSRSRRSA